MNKTSTWSVVKLARLAALNQLKFYDTMMARKEQNEANRKDSETPKFPTGPKP